jgi:hypothetical protein
MANTPNLDPLGLWRDMLGQWERGLNTIANEAMGSSEFSRAMHQVTTVGLQMQQAAGEAMEKSLKALNLPSRSDILALHDRLGRIEEALERLAPPAVDKPADGPARTRTPPAP